MHEEGVKRSVIRSTTWSIALSPERLVSACCFVFEREVSKGCNDDGWCSWATLGRVIRLRYVLAVDGACHANWLVTFRPCSRDAAVKASRSVRPSCDRGSSLRKHLEDDGVRILSAFRGALLVV